MEDQLQFKKQPEIVAETVKHTLKGLQSHNIRIHRRRTSVRLEPEMWRALNDIINKENFSLHALCTAIHDLKEEGASFTSTLRSFIVEYYRSSDTIRPCILYARNHIREQRLTQERQSC